MTSRILIRGGWVLTLGVRSPNLTAGDVLIEDDRVVEVGSRLRARDAEVIEAENSVVMPGFVDAHRHVWKTLFRNLGDREAGFDDAAAHHRPEDVYAATAVGLLSAAATGITTVVDWSDIQIDDEYTEAVLQAHVDSGLRTVLVLAGPGSAEAAMARPRPETPLTTLAFGPPDPDPADLEQSTGGWEAARRNGWRIHVHSGRRREEAGVVAAIARRGGLGEDVTVVHCSHLDDADLDSISTAGAAVVLAPSAEMAGGLGSPPLQRLIDRGIRPGLGVDDELLGPGDLFAQMRAAISIQHGRHFDLKLAGKGALPNLLTTREVIRYATVDGAKAAGLASVTGSLEVGKQADVIVLRTDRPNIHPINDPIGAVVWGMDSSNVAWVVAAGRVLMRDGELQSDVDGVRTRAIESHRRIAAAAGLAPVAGGEVRR